MTLTARLHPPICLWFLARSGHAKTVVDCFQPFMFWVDAPSGVAAKGGTTETMEVPSLQRVVPLAGQLQHPQGPGLLGLGLPGSGRLLHHRRLLPSSLHPQPPLEATQPFFGMKDTNSSERGTRTKQ